MTELYGRQAVLTVSEALPSAVDGVTSRTPDEIGGIEIAGLRIAFDIQRDLSLLPNRGQIKVYNMNRDSRRRLQAQATTVALQAGYRERELLFRGDVRRVTSRREGPDLITTLEVGDGAAEFKSARVNVSFGPGATFERVFRGLVAQTSLNADDALNTLRKPENLAAAAKKFARSWVASGRTLKELRRLVTSQGYELSIQDNYFQLLRNRQALQNTAILLSPDTGLLGSPTVTEDGGLACAALLIPGLRPGAQVQVEAKEADGLFRAERCRYVGDTRGQQWLIEIEGSPLERAA